MRKALVILLAFLVMFGFGACTYNAYMTKERPFQQSHLGYRNSTISGNTYSVQVRSKVFGRQISGYKYDIDDGILYLTVLYNPSGEKVMDVFKDEGEYKKYVKIVINAEEEIQAVRYRYHDRGNDVSWNYEKYLKKSSQIAFENTSLDADGVFRGTFRCTLNGEKLYNKTEKIEGNNLYISFTSTSGATSNLSPDENGNCNLEIHTQRPDIKNVYLSCGAETVLLATKGN